MTHSSLLTSHFTLLLLHCFFYSSISSRMTAHQDDHIQAKCLAQLGHFAKLPVEIRLKIWEFLFLQIHSANYGSTTPRTSILSIVRCSRYLHNETSNHLYDGLTFGIHIWPNYSEARWVTMKMISCHSHVIWDVKDKNISQKVLSNFPFHRAQKPEISVKIQSVSPKDHGQIVQLWQTVNGLVDILVTLQHPPHVRVKLKGRWHLHEKPKQHCLKHDTYVPDHDIAILPFSRLSWWDYSLPADFNAIILKDPKRQFSRSYQFRINGSSKVNRFRQISKHEIDDLKLLQIVIRMGIDKELDIMRGETADHLRLQRFQQWFSPGDGWESSYHKQLIIDLTDHHCAFMDIDSRLRAARRRYMMALLMHHAAHAALELGEAPASAGTKQSLAYTGWDPTVFSKVWPNGIPAGFNGTLHSWKPDDYSRILDSYTVRGTKPGEFWKELEWWGNSAYHIQFGLFKRVCHECEGLRGSCLWCQKYNLSELCLSCMEYSSGHRGCLTKP